MNFQIGLLKERKAHSEANYNAVMNHDDSHISTCVHCIYGSFTNFIVRALLSSTSVSFYMRNHEKPEGGKT